MVRSLIGSPVPQGRLQDGALARAQHSAWIPKYSSATPRRMLKLRAVFVLFSRRAAYDAGSRRATPFPAFRTVSSSLARSRERRCSYLFFQQRQTIREQYSVNWS